LPLGVCLRDTAVPLLAFCGGSGITPILSLAKSALATTDRRVRVLAANRDAGSVIFASALTELAGRYPARFAVRHSLDVRHGFVSESQVRDFVGGDGPPISTSAGPRLSWSWPSARFSRTELIPGRSSSSASSLRPTGPPPTGPRARRETP
jgi:NAD(P)H-flavin reductase